jgi:hypothetical protein
LEFTPDPNNPSHGPNLNALFPLFDSFIIVNPPALETIVTIKAKFPDNMFYVKQKDNNAALLERGIDVVVDSSVSVTFQKMYVMFKLFRPRK